MTEPTERRVVRPFPDDDPLCYPELTPEMLALRALLAVLADTGAAVVFPSADLCPSLVQVEVAAGWRLLVGGAADPETAGGVQLTAQWVAAPHVPRPPEVTA